MDRWSWAKHHHEPIAGPEPVSILGYLYQKARPSMYREAGTKPETVDTEVAAESLETVAINRTT